MRDPFSGIGKPEPLKISPSGSGRAVSPRSIASCTSFATTGSISFKPGTSIELLFSRHRRVNAGQLQGGNTGKMLRVSGQEGPFPGDRDAGDLIIRFFPDRKIYNMINWCPRGCFFTPSSPRGCCEFEMLQWIPFRSLHNPAADAVCPRGFPFREALPPIPLRWWLVETGWGTFPIRILR